MKTYHTLNTSTKALIIAAVFLAAILIGLIFAANASAAEACRKHYSVKPHDTLRGISAYFGAQPWYIVRANRVQAEAPNYPLYAFTSICIPYNTGTAKPLPDRVLDQPAGEWLATQRGGKLTIQAANFALGSNWTIRAGGDKAGKLRITNKGNTTKTVNAPAKLATVCLKNQRTDLVLCAKVRQVR